MTDAKLEKDMEKEMEANNSNKNDLLPISDGETSFEKTSLDVEAAPAPAPAPNMEHMNFPDGGVRAWSVAIAASGVLFTTFGYANAFGVFQEYYQTHQLVHETSSSISWIGSIQVFFLFAGNCFGGPLFDRFGAKIIWPPAILYIFSVMMSSISKKYYQFILSQGILGGITMGMTMSPVMAATGQYFFKNRGAAMGIAIAGSSLGGVIFPIALSKMLAHPKLGFGWTIRILGFIMMAVILPSCAVIRARLPPRKGQFFLPHAFKEPTYVGVLLSAFLNILGVFMPIFYLPTFAVEHGMSLQLANYLIAILNGASFFGRVIPGVLGDKLGRMNAFAAASLSTGILIMCMTKLNSNASIIVFAVLYGFCSGAIVSGMSVVLAQIPKDPRNIGTYMGMGMSVTSVAALIGPPIDGAFVTRYGGFNEVAYFCGAVTLLGGIGVLVTKFTTEKGFWSKT